MALGVKQQRKYEKIMRNRGKAAADQYASGLNAGTQGPANVNLSRRANRASRNVDTGNVGSIANSQRAENIASNQYNAPNQQDMYGSRNVTFDKNGQATVTTQLNQPQQQLLDQQTGFRSGVNNFVGSAMGQYQGFNPGAYQDPRFQQFQQQMTAFSNGDTSGLQNYSANTGQQVPQMGGVPQYGNVQNDVTQRAMNMYDRNTSQNLTDAREQQMQQLVNSGNGPGTPIYERTMRNFEQNAQNSRLNAIDQAYISGQQATNAAFNSQLQGNQQGFNQNFQTNNQRFDQQYATSMAPIEASRSFLPYAGQFNAPNYGAIQQFNPQPVNTGGIAAGIYNADQSNQARLGAAGISAGATTAAAGISANAALEAQRLRGDQALEQIGAQTAAGLGF